MRRGGWIAAMLLLCPALATAAERVIAERQWDAGTLPEGATRVGAADRIPGALRIEGRDDRATSIALWTLDAPGVAKPAHALRGTVRHHDVRGTGYLEMWTRYGDQERYFSRTLATEGPLRNLTGSSEWRPFTLPFFGAAGRHPTRIDVNLVLPGAGSVELGGMTLVELDGAQDLSTGAAGGWWDDRTGGLVGAVLGSGIGLLGAAIGSLCSLGRARRLVGALLAAAIGIGALTAALGLAALATGQPYPVYYPLLLGGGIALALGLGAKHSVRRRYEELELRRMHALDVG